MCVDMHECDGCADHFERTHDRDGHAVIAAQRDQRRTGREYFSGRGLGTSIVFQGVRFVRRDIATVHDSDVAAVEQRPAQVPVVVVPGIGDIGRAAGLPDRIRRPALVVRRRLVRVRLAERDTENRDIGVELVEIGQRGEIKKRFFQHLRAISLPRPVASCQLYRQQTPGEQTS